ncbi:MAG: malto-oligosyltrehalose trehalohydrolase [Bacteroidetes bacterium]|nr:malto-oligosyltrehalose trehalohydrolase [Bacteroidota bacterium]
MPAPFLDNDQCHFSVWAPAKKAMTLHLLSPAHTYPMTKDVNGYFHADVPNINHGDQYLYQPNDDIPLPDPASPWQPKGVHGPSAIVDHAKYDWQDHSWHNHPFSSLIFYELHVGTFTPEGTFEAIIPRLHQLAELGINAIELMPVAQCPGSRNWGYDEAFLYAVANNYGGPDGLKALVDACHQRGIAVFLDVIYNHIGREGNILNRFGPYFTDKYHTPWGPALNFDGAWSDGVKEFVIGNVLHWAEHFHIDGLRLDAIHEIFDRNAITIWDQLRGAVSDWEERSLRRFYLIAESDLNSPRVVQPTITGGKGFDAQWLDDFHHSLYVLLDRKVWKHYKDFGHLSQLAKAYTEGFVHSNEYVFFRQRKHGASSAGLPGHRFVVFNQNHDLPGNRPDGKRLSALVDLPRLKLAAAAVLLSPYIPLLFMGEEYGETNPFYFFSDYSDPEITNGLQEGRKKQFAEFDWDGEPKDSQAIETFQASILDWDRRKSGSHAELLAWHKKLLDLRKNHPLLSDLTKNNFRADLLSNQGVALYRHSADQSHHLLCLLNFSDHPLTAHLDYGAPETPWKNVLDHSTSLGFLLVLPPWGVSVYEQVRASATAMMPVTK